MRMIGCDLHAAQQTIAMLDRDTGEIVERTLAHEGTTVRDFYASLPAPIVVGIEATGSMGWFLRLMEELGVTCHVGDPARIRRGETRRQKHDRRDAALLLELLRENRFPSIWMPSSELCDLRALLLHRDQWVRMRARVKNALQGLALAHGIRRGAGLWTRGGQSTLASLPLALHAGHRRSELQALNEHLTKHIDDLDQQVSEQARERPQARRLMTHPGVGPVTALATEVFLGDARPIVAAISRVVFSRVTPLSIGHRALRCLVPAVWVVREDGLAVAARSGSGDVVRRGVSPRRSTRGVVSRARALWATDDGSGRRWCRPRSRSRPNCFKSLYAPFHGEGSSRTT